MSQSEPPFDLVQITPEFKAELLKEERPLIAQKKLIDATGCSFFVAKWWYYENLEPKSKPTPCPYCGKPVATPKAKQCFSCGMDWHGPDHAICRGDPEWNRLGLKNESLYAVMLCQDSEGGRYTKFREIGAEPSDQNMVYETESAHGSQLAEWGDLRLPRYLRLSTGERFGFEDGKTWMTEKEIEYVRRKRRGLVGNEEQPPWVNGITPLPPK